MITETELKEIEARANAAMTAAASPSFSNPREERDRVTAIHALEKLALRYVASLLVEVRRLQAECPNCVLLEATAISHAALEKENTRLRETLENLCKELGVPQPGYPMPVANAYDIARAALKEEG